jgi:hypothetical protein
MPPFCSENNTGSGWKNGQESSSPSNFAAALHQAIDFESSRPLPMLGCSRRACSVPKCKRRKVVRFDLEVSVHEIPNRHSLSRAGCQRLFYNRTDLARMEEENKATLALMSEAIYPDSEEACFRGLEADLTDVMVHRKQMISAVKAVVLRKGNSGQLPCSFVEMEKLHQRIVAQSQEAAIIAAAWDAENCH